MNLHGAVCVVTGAASGLGAATAALLLERGARVAAFDIAFQPARNASDGQSLLSLRVDVTDARAVTDAMERVIEHFGVVNVCVNCAGILAGAPVVGECGVFPPDLFRRVIDINLTGTFLVLCRAAERMASNAPDPVPALTNCST